MESEQTIVVDQLRVKIVDEADGSFNLTVLDGLAYFNAFVERLGVIWIANAGFSSELIGRLFEPLCKENRKNR